MPRCALSYARSRGLPLLTDLLAGIQTHCCDSNPGQRSQFSCVLGLGARSSVWALASSCSSLQSMLPPVRLVRLPCSPVHCCCCWLTACTTCCLLDVRSWLRLSTEVLRRDAECFVQIVNLLNLEYPPEVGQRLAEQVLATLAALLAGEALLRHHHISASCQLVQQHAGLLCRLHSPRKRLVVHTGT